MIREIVPDGRETPPPSQTQQVSSSVLTLEMCLKSSLETPKNNYTDIAIDISLPLKH